MHEQSRRQFLTHSAAAAGMLALGGQRLLAEQAAAAKPADMTIARWAGKAKPTAAEMKQIAVRLTEKAIEGLGGLGRFVSRNAVVWVKPNIGWDRLPEQAANTNPDVVATLVRLCFQAGAKVVKVGDNPCNIAAKTYERSGIAPAVREAGGQGRVPRSQPLPRNEHRRRTIEDAAGLSRDPGVRPGDQRPGGQAPCPGWRHNVHEELHGRDRAAQLVAPGHARLRGRSDAIHETEEFAY